MGGTKRKEDTENAAPSLLHPKRLDGNGRLVALVAAALALIRTAGGNSSNEEESWQIAEIATVKNCVLLRVCRTSAASPLSMAFCVQAAAEMCFKGDINPLLSQMQILQKQEKI